MKSERCAVDSDTGPVSFTSDSFHVSVQDQYSADLYHFATKEDDYANYFIRVSLRYTTLTKQKVSSFQTFKSARRFPQSQLLELQAEYHKNSHEFLSKNISELKESHSQTGEVTSLASHRFTATFSWLMADLFPLCLRWMVQVHQWASPARRSTGSL